MKVYVVYYGGGLIGIYDNNEAAERVKQARNDYATRTQSGKRVAVMARVEEWDVQSEPAPEDL